MVGQFVACASRPECTDGLWLLARMALMHVLLQTLVAWLFARDFQRAGWIKSGDIKVGS